MIDKLAVILLVSVLLLFSAVAEHETNQSLNSSVPESATLAEEANPLISILPAADPVEQTADSTPISILPVEEIIPEEVPVEEIPAAEPVVETPAESTPAEEPVSETVTPDSLTGGTPVPIVQKIKTFLSVVLDKIKVFIGQMVKIRALLVDENQNPVPHQSIDFYLGAQKIGSEITNDKGEAAVFWDSSPTSAGVYTVKADYPGNDQYEGSSAGAEVTVEEPPKAEEEIVLTPLAVQAQSSVTPLQTCTPITYEGLESVYGTCTRLTEPVVCSDAPSNTSCNTPAQETYQCITGTQKVQKTRDECDTFGYMLDNGVKSVKLTTEDYSCSTTEQGGVVTVLCDSKLDGNGNGVCSSGESCQKFVLEGESFVKYEKNSEDDFTAGDDSYFLARSSAEVIK